MFRISTIALLGTTLLSGCADKTESSKQQLVSVVEGARESGLLQKAHEQLEKAARRMESNKGSVIPSGSDQDRAVAQRGQAALMAYFEIPQAVDQVTGMIASARKLYAQNVAAYDQAVASLKFTDSVFPNYSVYEFARATIDILANALFEIDSYESQIEIQKALICTASKSQCDVSPMTSQLLSLKERIMSVFPPHIAGGGSDLKLVFVPLYVLANQVSIPMEYREMFLNGLTGFVTLVEAIDSDPESAQAIMDDLRDRIRPTFDEEVLLMKIGQNIATIVRGLGVDWYVEPIVTNTLHG